MNLDEILSLTEDALAVFGPDAELVAVSPAFRGLFQPVEAFLAPGTPWPLFLTEAVRQDLLQMEASRRLAMIEESLTDPARPASEVVAKTASGTLTFALKAASDGGFALRVARQTSDDAAEERELEQIMSKVLEACPTCLTMARIGDGHILYRSPEATALLGKGFNSRAHFVNREERADFITALLPGARVDDLRFTARHAEGHEFEAAISARLIDYRGEDVIVSSITDLTEELALQDELGRQKEQVFQSEKMSALGEVLAGVAHELNNPLSIVVGNAQMLLEDGIDGPALKRVEKVSDAAERCVGIVRAFLSMARDRPLKIESLAVDMLLDTARDAFEATEPGEIEIAIEAHEGLPPVQADEVQIVQVVTNLMINAEQAMKGQADGRIALSAMHVPEKRLVRLRVTDNGPGVPPDIAPRIFDPLFTTKEIGKGTGIGLALCHRIVTAHGGRISLDQRAKQGAAFTIDLPADTVEVDSP